jgi:hypothetical protein
LEIFPLLAQKGLLNGHLSSQKELHIHSASDIKKAEELLSSYTHKDI